MNTFFADVVLVNDKCEVLTTHVSNGTIGWAAVTGETVFSGIG